jgi:hypothetical protein
MSYNVRLFNLFKWIDKEDVLALCWNLLMIRILIFYVFKNSLPAAIDLKVYRHKYINGRKSN